MPTLTAPANTFTLKDAQAGARAVDAWLRRNTDDIITLDRLKNTAGAIPVVGNILSAIDVIADVMELIDTPKLREDIFTWVNLGIDLMGCVPAAGNAVKAGIRPALHQLRNSMKDLAQGIISEQLYNTLTTHFGGDAYKFIESLQKNLDDYIQKISKYLTNLLNNFSSMLKEVVNKGIQVSTQVEDSTAAFIRKELASGKLTFIEAVEARIALAAALSLSSGKKASNKANRFAASQIPKALKEKIRKIAKIFIGLAKTAIDWMKKIGNLNAKGSLAQLLQQTLRAMTNLKNKKNNKNKKNEKGAPVKTVNVSPNKSTTTKKEQPQKKLESSKKLAPTEKSPNGCKNGTCAASGKSIDYALGYESVTHTDFSLAGQTPLIWSRTYQSSLESENHNPLGARWMSNYSMRIWQKDDGLYYLAEDARIHALPSLPEEGDSTHNAIEGFTVARLAQDILAVSYESEVVELYQATPAHPQDYRLATITARDQGRIHLAYDHQHQERNLLSDIWVVQDGQTTAHCRTLINEQGQIHALWQVEDGKLTRQLCHYEHNREGDLTLAQDENAHAWHYEYQHHLLHRYTDRTGRGVNLRYDGNTAQAKAIHEWMDDGSFEVKLNFIPEHRLTQVQDAHGQITQYYCDILGYTYRIIYPDSREEWFYRDDNKNITQHIFPNGSEEHYQYNAQQKVIRHTRADGSVVGYQYDEPGNLIAIQDPEGGIWQREYNEHKLITQETDPLGRSTQYQYNTQRLLTQVQDAKGGTQQLAYNAIGQLTSHTDCSGKTQTWQYDARGRLISHSNALTQTTHYHYAKTGYLARVEHPDGSEEHYHHDAEGRLLTHTDPLGQKHDYRYNHAGLLAEHTDPLHGVVEYTWNKIGQLTAIVNQNNHAYRYQYTPQGRLISETDFDGKTLSYHYDSNGILQRIEEPHKTTELTFDPMGRLKGRQSQLKAQASHVTPAPENFDYDGNGRLIQASNAMGRLQWFYDDAGQLEREHQQYRYRGKDLTAVTQHRYDALGNRIHTIRPDGHTHSWLTYGSGHSHELLIDGQTALSLERDDLHRIHTRHHHDPRQANSPITHRSQQDYDRMGRITQQRIHHQQGTLIRQRQYAYDAAGQLQQIQDSLQGNTQYRYDPLGNLLFAHTPQGQEHYRYDPAGNRHTGQDPAPVRLDNLIKEQAGQRYHYDASGNLTLKQHPQEGDTHHHWDVYNRLIKTESRHLVIHYRYDALGRRIIKDSQALVPRNPMDGSQVQAHRQHSLNAHYGYGLTLYGWDGDTMVWESQQQLGQHSKPRTTHYYYEYDNPFVPVLQAYYAHPITLLATPDYASWAEYRAEDDTVWTDAPKGEETVQGKRRNLQLEAQHSQFTHYAHYHTDPLGSPQSMTDGQGQVVWCAQYSAWGMAQVVEGGAPSNHLADGVWIGQGMDERLRHLASVRADNGYVNPLRFQGQYFDFETGLHYNRYRYYDPVLGRFVSKDPIGLLGGLHAYAYAPNPVGWVDPLGLSACKTKNKKTVYNAETRRDALRQAKRDSKIEMSQKPIRGRENLLDGKGNKIIGIDGQPVTSRTYTYTNIRGDRVVIQEHSRGHEKATQGHGADPHFNVRPIDNTQTGHYEGTHGHYNFPQKGCT